MHEPGEFIASGRDAEIFAHGPGLVLRRARGGRSLAAEARVMEHARRGGFPVPAVHEVSDDGTAIVMERVDGPSLMDRLQRRPWAMGRGAAVLADLHRRLHELDGPDWLPAAPGPAGDRLLHLDLHPLNVIMGPNGPVVIDWTGAARGDPAVDLALTWVLLAGGEIPGGRLAAAVLGRFRNAFVGRFLAHVDRGQARAVLGDVVEWKVGDPNMSGREKAAMRALVPPR